MKGELHHHDEQLMRAYLLGKLPESERLEVEQRYFTDDDFFLLISSLEEELIRDFVRGELPAADVAEFERRVAEAPDLARKVAAERALVAALLPAPVTVSVPAGVEAVERPVASDTTPAVPSLLGWLREVLSTPVFAWRFATVGLAAAVALVTFWGVENQTLRQQVAQLSADKSGLEGKLALAQPPSPIPFRLAAGQQRGKGGGSSVPGTLTLGPASKGKLVRLELEVGVSPEYRRYEATLRTLIGGVAVLHQDLTPGEGPLWVFHVPEVALRGEAYRLDVQGVTGAGAKVDLPSAAFAVVRQPALP